ncbi:MAG: porin family protein [Petrimonas sp.]|uniref:porin family protein n=1 Tax=Petrimonas sp. TaxID=2023866 RepID=UPI002B3CDD6A|nr:porin family protein [Petrimonas sp.]MEA4997013.1 porin family protein [Petrimonas sp.]MEA5044429.1 porin family protein [Petrimonas sp.]HMM17211.1 porin family protein [Petrimonas sp.]
MKRLLPGILLFMLFTVQVFAQKNDFEKEFYIGVGGGAFMSTVDFVPAVLQKPSLGIHGGISAKYISEKHLGLMVELNYAQRGWTENFPAESGFSYSKTLNYLEVPFMTHIYFGNNVRFVINVGPQLGFLLGSSNHMNEALSANITAKREENPEAQIGMQYILDPGSFDYGLIGGIGMELKTGAGNVGLEGRYYFGLGDVFENRKTKENFFFSRSAHRIIEAKLSYFFKVK